MHQGRTVNFLDVLQSGDISACCDRRWDRRIEAQAFEKKPPSLKRSLSTRAACLRSCPLGRPKSQLESCF
jgi:hypothetical protein